MYPVRVTEPYRHTQVGWTLIVLVVAVALLDLTIVALSTPSTLALAFAGALSAVFAVALILFASLTVVVDGVVVRLWFGAGVLRREVLLQDVVAVRKVRNHRWSGWGVRVLSNGRLYNVGGLDAVELELEGGRVVRIGTDEPDALLTAVKRALPGGGGR